MALWLAEALGEDPEKVRAADEDAYNEPNKMRRSGIVRKHFPFDRIIELMSADPDAQSIIIRTREELERKAKEYLL